MPENLSRSLSARRAWIEIRTRSQPSRPRTVALRKESVDRNTSPYSISCMILVALRKESVDRNFLLSLLVVGSLTSLSARRAWIEIIDYIIEYVNDAVALRKESVDRNYIIKITVCRPAGRSPQGERG